MRSLVVISIRFLPAGHLDFRYLVFIAIQVSLVFHKLVVVSVVLWTVFGPDADLIEVRVLALLQVEFRTGRELEDLHIFLQWKRDLNCISPRMFLPLPIPVSHLDQLEEQVIKEKGKLI